MIKYNLPNGVRVYYYYLPNTYSVACGLYIDTGVKDESKENNGITHLLEHLHFRKLGDWEQEEIYYQMNKIGATLSGSTYKELLKFSIKARPKYFFDCLEFYLRILSTYDWTEKHLYDEKQIVLNEIYSKEPYMSISPYVDEIVWGDSALSMSILGNAESVENIALEQIVQYKRQCFCGGKIAFVITGNVPEKDVQTANDRIGQIQLNDNPIKACKKKDSDPMTIINEKSRLKFINCNWDYVDVNVSFDIADCDSDIAGVVNSIIGGGVGSILHNIVREKLGFVYDIYSTLDLYNDKSVLNIIFSSEKKNIYRCLEEIVIVLNNIKKEITPKDILANITYFTENTWYLLESPEVLNEELGWTAFSKKEASFSIKEKIESYKNINEQKMMNFAKNTFVSTNIAVVILGNTLNITKKAVKEIINGLDTVVL